MMTQIWDTGNFLLTPAGQEKYRAICQNQYRDALGAILVFDLTRRQTFENCVAWLEEFRLNSLENSQIMIVGNKLDIVEISPDVRAVEKSEAQRFAEDNDGFYVETSAVSNKNVDEAFVDLLQEIYYTFNGQNPNLNLGGFSLNNSVVEEEKVKDDGCC